MEKSKDDPSEQWDLSAAQQSIQILFSALSKCSYFEELTESLMIFIRGAHTFIDDLILLCHLSDIRIRRCTKVTGGLEKQHKLDL